MVYQLGVDADHGTALSDVDATSHPEIMEDGRGRDFDASREEGIPRNMSAMDRQHWVSCAKISDMGKLMWLKEYGLDSRLVKYVPSNISPENRLLIAKHKNILF